MKPAAFKNWLLLLTLALLPGAASYGQYTMTVTSVPYQPLANPTSLNNGAVWNEGTSFPLYFNSNFSFQVKGQAYTALNVMAGGGLGFPGMGFKQLFVYHTPFGGYLLRDRSTTASLSAIGYAITGTTGQRVLKVEWRNAGLVRWFATSDSTDYVDLQVWLFENDNHVEIHFGSNKTNPGTYGYPGSTTDPNPGPSVKLWSDSCSNVLCVSGPANLPSYGTYSLCAPSYYFLAGTPASGTTYNFFPPKPAGIEAVPSGAATLHPNPFSDRMTVSFPTAQHDVVLTVRDVTGRTVRTAAFSGTQYTLERRELTSGVYFLEVKDRSGKAATERIVVQ